MYHLSKNVSMKDWSLFVDEEWLPKLLISLFAAFADAGGCMMESEDSTNIYVPKSAANEVVNILNDSEIQWDSLITDKVRDLKTHRMAVIPYRILLEAGEIMKSYHAKDDRVNYHEACNYLMQEYFPYAMCEMESNDRPDEYFVHQFLFNFCIAVNQLGKVTALEDGGNMVWIFRIVGDPLIAPDDTSNTDRRIREALIKLPPQYDSLMSSIYNTLDHFKQDEGKNRPHSERLSNCKEEQKACLGDWEALKGYWTEQCAGVEKNARFTDVLQAIQSKKGSSKKGSSKKGSSKKTPLNEMDIELLIEYLIDQVVDERRQFPRSVMKTLIKSLLEGGDIPEFNSTTPYYYDNSVQGMLCGSLSKKKIRVVILSVGESEVLQKALDLQPKPIKSFFGGTLAATSFNRDSKVKRKIAKYRGWYTNELQAWDKLQTEIPFPKSFEVMEEVELQIIEARGLSTTLPETQSVSISQTIHKHFEGHEKLLTEDAISMANSEEVLYNLLYGRCYHQTRRAEEAQFVQKTRAAAFKEKVNKTGARKKAISAAKARKATEVSVCGSSNSPPKAGSKPEAKRPVSKEFNLRNRKVVV
jgi:hypothetical protein